MKEENQRKFDGISLLSAEYLKVYNAFRGLDVLILVEDDDDVHFWQPVMERNSWPLKPLCISLRSHQLTKGKSAILRQDITPSLQLLVCVDSDYDKYLSAGTNIKDRLDQEFVFQTGVYAVENFWCAHETINEFVLTGSNLAGGVCGFDLQDFLVKLSEIIYKPFLYSVFFYKLDKDSRAIMPCKGKLKKHCALFSPKKFWQMIWPEWSVLDPGSFTCDAVLNQIRERVENGMKAVEAEIHQVAGRDLSTEVDLLSGPGGACDGIVETDTYLYINGHHLVWLITPLLLRAIVLQRFKKVHELVSQPIPDEEIAQDLKHYSGELKSKSCTGGELSELLRRIARAQADEVLRLADPPPLKAPISRRLQGLVDDIWKLKPDVSGLLKNSEKFRSCPHYSQLCGKVKHHFTKYTEEYAELQSWRAKVG